MPLNSFLHGFESSNMEKNEFITIRKLVLKVLADFLVVHNQFKRDSFFMNGILSDINNQ